VRLAAYMAVGSVLVALLIALLPGVGGLEIFLGMLAPTAVTSGEWVVTERRFREAPESVSALMLQMFLLKAVLFAAYLAIVLVVSRVDAVPFVVSFVGFFLVLFVIEAAGLHRLGRETVSNTGN
jgi:hypothetical protein